MVEQLLFAFLWWSLTVFLGLLSFPLVSRFCSSLPERGYAAAKPLGMVVATYLVWLLPSLKLVPFGVGDILIALAFLALLSFFAASTGGKFRIRELISGKTILSEIVFASAFAFFLWMLWQRPDIYFAQLEDFADFGFIQSIHRSAYFPPQDPWFAGKSLPYYYGGHLMAAWMGRLAHIPPEIAFNLSAATSFALAVSVSFGLGYNLTRKVIFGLCAAVFVALMGYITGLFQLLAWVFQVNILGFSPSEARGLEQWFLTFEWWKTIWIIPNTVTFYPFYILSNADVHPMATSIPFQLLCLQLALAFMSRHAGEPISSVAIQYLLFSLSLGFLLFTNSWAYPVFLLFLFLVAFIYGRRLLSMTLAAALSAIFYLPFILSRTIRGFHGIGFVAERTPLYGYLGIFGTFWFFLFAALLILNKGKWLRIIVPVSAAAVGALVGWWLDFQILALLLPAAALAMPLVARGLSDSERFFVSLVIVGLGLAAGADLFYLKDSYGNPFERYNTVMKVYLMQWVFLAVASACALFTMRNHLKGILKLILFSVGMLFIAASLIHPVASTAGWTSGRLTSMGTGRGSLDGLAYLKTFNEGDYEAIKWLNENVAGTSIILETPSYAEIAVYKARVSSLTGLSTLLGWGPWEVQWGREWAEVEERTRDTATIYNSEKTEEALDLIRKYGIALIYIGQMERESYSRAGLAKFAAEKSDFEKIYENEVVEIYRVL